MKRTVSFMTRDKEVIEWTKSLLTTKTTEFIFHNANYEIKIFSQIWGIMVDNLYIDSQILVHCFDARSGTSGLKPSTFKYVGVAEYEKKAKPYFKCIPSDKGTLYEKSPLALNQLPIGLERGKEYEAGLYFPLEGNSPEITEENKRREKLYNRGWLTEDDILTYVAKDSYYCGKVVNYIKPRLMNEREWEAVKFYSKSTVTHSKISLNGIKINICLY